MKGAQGSNTHVPMGALLSLLAVGACSANSQPPVRSVGYYRSHAAEWERRVWDCTNEPPAFERSSDGLNALLALKAGALPEAGKPQASSNLRASTD